MIKSLITSQTRIKLLLKFFLNSNTRAHLRGLEAEFGESSNSIRIELNRLEEAELLNSERDGNKKFYFANPAHPLFNEIHSILLKETGIDRVIEKVVRRVGELKCVYLTGDLAKGRDSSIIDLVLVGTGIDREYLWRKIDQAEKLTGRKIKYLLLNTAEANSYLDGFAGDELFLLWDSGCEVNKAIDKGLSISRHKESDTVNQDPA